MDFEISNGAFTPVVAGREIVSDELEESAALDPNEKTFDIVGSGSSHPPVENPDLLRLRLRTARERIFKEYYQVGTDLFQVLNTHLYLKWGFESFADYVDAEVGLSLKYALNYVKIFAKFNQDLGLRPEQLEGVGVTKALALTDKVITRTNAEEWIDKARQTTTTDLREKIKLSRPPKYRAIPRNSPEALIGLEKARMDESLLIDDTDDPPIVKTFYLYPKQLDFIEKVLSEMPHRTESSKDGNNLSLLLLEHQALRAAVGDKVEKRPHTILEGFEATFGGVVRWFTTKEQAQAILKFMEDNPDTFKGDE